MASDVVLAAFIIAVGLSVAGAGTHLYQGLSGQMAMLRFDGRNFLGTLGHLAMSFVCGPYIMLKLGWTHTGTSSIAVGSALLSALVAFGWSFITGLFFMGVYLSLAG